MVFSGLVGASLFAQHAWPFVAGFPLAQAFFLVALPRLRAFRRHVDKARDAQARDAQDAAWRERLLKMNEHHRRRLQSLEALRRSIHRRLNGDDAQATWREPLIALQRLIDCFAHLAIVHDDAQRALALVPPSAGSVHHEPAFTLDAETDGAVKRDLEAVATLAVEQRQQRRALEQRRLLCRRENQAALATIREQLITIEEMVRLVHEQTAVCVDPKGITDHLTAIFDDLESMASSVRALLELRTTLDG